MSEKIIIIGGSGAIGKAFVEFYKEQNSSNIYIRVYYIFIINWIIRS